MLEYSEEQLKCIDTVCKKIKNGQDVTIIWGPAGSGKSSIVGGIVEELGIRDNEIKFATYTGKASLVLRRKNLPSSTIHKLIYNAHKDKKTGKFFFTKKECLDDPLIRLIVVDEYYMVGKKIFDDLKSFNIPILCLGDPFQLPPVKDNENEYSNDCDFRLTKNYRQKDGNSITEVANRAKDDGVIPNIHDNFCKIEDSKDLSIGMLQWADQILCCTNKVRKDLNDKIREQLGKKGSCPTIGDKIICVRNDWNCLSEKGEPLVNGMVGYVTQIYRSKLDYLNSYMDIEFRPDYDMDDRYKIRIDLNPFMGYTPYKNDFRKFITTETRELFDFGYAISVHKSQGSEWDKILFYCKDLWGSEETRRQLLYTGITRAKERLVLVK